MVREGWITSGNIRTRPEILMLDNTLLAGHGTARAKEFSSKIVIQQEGKTDTATVIREQAGEGLRLEPLPVIV